MFICAECGRDGFRFLNEDPRDPPLDVGDCLCAFCAECAIDQAQGELQDRIEELNLMKDKLK